jgi:hypothetical protein
VRENARARRWPSVEFRFSVFMVFTPWLPGVDSPGLIYLHLQYIPYTQYRHIYC